MFLSEFGEFVVLYMVGEEVCLILFLLWVICVMFLLCGVLVLIGISIWFVLFWFDFDFLLRNVEDLIFCGILDGFSSVVLLFCFELDWFDFEWFWIFLEFLFLVDFGVFCMFCLLDDEICLIKGNGV